MDRHFMVGQMAGNGIAVTLHRHQTRAGNTRQHFDIAIEWGWHRHQIHLLLFESIGDGNACIVWMPRLGTPSKAGVRVEQHLVALHGIAR